MVRAQRFKPPPMLLDVLEEQFPYRATSQSVALSRVDADADLKLHKIPAILPEFDPIANAKLLDQALGGGKSDNWP